MSTRQEQALSYFDSGFNCAQSVVAVFSEKYDVDKETALRMSGGLGGGFRCGEICGAASGAVLVIGLKYGQYNPGDKKSKADCNAKTSEFLKRFKAENGSIVCREILQAESSDPEVTEQAKKKSRAKCKAMVNSAVALLEELGY